MTLPKFPCPSCGDYLSKVWDSRAIDDYILRRRRCLTCGTNYATKEILIKHPPTTSRTPNR